jgi:hypothetical protein
VVDEDDEDEGNILIITDEDGTTVTTYGADGAVVVTEHASAAAAEPIETIVILDDDDDDEGTEANPIYVDSPIPKPRGVLAPAFVPGRVPFTPDSPDLVSDNPWTPTYCSDDDDDIGIPPTKGGETPFYRHPDDEPVAGPATPTPIDFTTPVTSSVIIVSPTSDDAEADPGADDEPHRS